MTLFFLLSGHISQKQKFRSTKLSFNAIDSMPHQKYEADLSFHVLLSCYPTRMGCWRPIIKIIFVFSLKPFPSIQCLPTSSLQQLPTGL